MIPDRYPYKVGYSWAPPYRFQRVTEVLQQAQAGNKLDVADMQRLQTDVLSLPAAAIDRPAARGHGAREPSLAAELLLRWNAKSSATRPPPRSMKSGYRS